MIDYLDESSNQSNDISRDNKTVIRKIICRYGRGCTHMQDPVHRERFWHPYVPQLTDEIITTHHLCNECGAPFKDLNDLLLHLKRKTAWSNSSLVGCRISCLVDYKEWHEGFVTQFHKSGKHFVEFRLVGEKRWLNMKKVAFYIVERPQMLMDHCEFKDDDYGDIDGSLAPIEDNWVYVEDLTLEFAFVQSLLFKIYGASIQETGHKTKGHVCVTDSDKERARVGKGSLLYGELLPRGANKAFSPKRLSAESATCLFDLGMGTGKIAIQAFLQFRNLRYVYGVELSVGRYLLAEEAALRMVKIIGEEKFNVICHPGKRIIISEIPNIDEEVSSTSSKSLLSNVNNNKLVDDYYSCFSDSCRKERVLHLECNDMFNVTNIEIADIVMLETDIPNELHPNLCRLLDRMHDGSKTLTYLDIRKLWSIASLNFQFKQLECNKYLSDRFPTSWSVQRGHHFFLWIKSNSYSISNDISKLSYLSDDSSNENSIKSNSNKLLSLSNYRNNDNTKERKRTSDNNKNGNCLPFSIDFLNGNFFSRFIKRRDQNDKEVVSERVIIPVNPNRFENSNSNLGIAAPNQVVILSDSINNNTVNETISTISNLNKTSTDDLKPFKPIQSSNGSKRGNSPNHSTTIVIPGSNIPVSNIDLNENSNAIHNEVVSGFLETPYTKHRNDSSSIKINNDIKIQESAIFHRNISNEWIDHFNNNDDSISVKSDSILDDNSVSDQSSEYSNSSSSLVQSITNANNRQITPIPIISNQIIQSHISMKSNNSIIGNSNSSSRSNSQNRRISTDLSNQSSKSNQNDSKNSTCIIM